MVLIVALIFGGLIGFNYWLILVADILYIIAFKIIVAWQEKELNPLKGNIVEEGIVLLVISLLSLGVAFKHPFVLFNILILLIMKIMPTLKIELKPKFKIELKRKDRIYRESK